MPSPAPEIGEPGYATSGIVGQTSPSTIDPDTFNTHQEELCTIVETAKLDLDKKNNGQVLAALKILFASSTALTDEVSRAQKAEAALQASLGHYLSTDTGGTVNGDLALGNGKWLHVDGIMVSSADAITFNSPARFAGDMTLTNDKWLHVDTITDGGSGKTSFAAPVEFDSVAQADGGILTNVLSGISGSAITVKNHLTCSASLSVTNDGTQFAGNQGDASNPIGGKKDGAYFDGHSLFVYGSQTPVYIGTGSSTNLINFYNGASFIGSIANSGSSVAYNTTSDYRAKTDIAALDTEDAMARICALRPVSHAWKNTPDLPRTHGFIAHELQAEAPYAVTGSKDAVDEDGKPVLQAVDLTRLVPDLVAALQGALRRIGALEAMVPHP
ncbi:MAG: tail fiber domain-containing protein [Acetobacter sp.]|uniref:tail fiber domain-containing protein n=1 Tax=Acetobacter sp. TaxID=440 RepID=UPI003F910FCE